MVGRQGILAVVLIACVVLSGCAATQQEFRFEASPASFENASVSEAGYEQTVSREVVRNRSVEAGGSTRDVTVVNHLRVYERQATIEPLGEQQIAAAAVFTSPSISIVGQEFNPLADAEPRRLVRQATSVAGEDLPGGGLQNVQFEETRTTTVLGTQTNLSVFTATTSIQGVSVDVFVHVARVKHEGDFVIVAGVFPVRFAEEERPRLQTLFDATTHESE